MFAKDSEMVTADMGLGLRRQREENSCCLFQTAAWLAAHSLMGRNNFPRRNLVGTHVCTDTSTHRQHACLPRSYIFTHSQTNVVLRRPQ